MGQLVEGQWQQGSIIKSDSMGAFDRPPSRFRDSIAKDHATYTPDSGRYHLYVSYACPWATRALILRTLKGLEDHISVSVVHPDMLEYGWTFSKDFKGATGDTLYGLEYLYEIYQKAQDNVTSKVTVPVLWDKQSQTIVNNESSEIIRLFNSAFNSLTGNDEDYYPKALHEDINAWNDKIYHHVNNGVYRSGFAKSQAAYEEAVTGLFDTLTELNDHLTNKTYLVGDQLTEADIRLVPTLLRFDLVYYSHFKTNLRHISDYPHLHRYMRALYELDAVKKNHDFDHIKRHYYYSHESLNPHRIVPLGPETFL